MKLPRQSLREMKYGSLALAAMLAACGGGGGASVDASSAGPLSLSGVVAVGAALSGATVEANCATGSGQATSLTDGSYLLTIESGALPCVLRATSSDGATVLHSVAPAGDTAGSSATANITPLSELLVAQLAGTSPEDFFTAAATDAAALGTTVTPAAVSGAQTAVVATLGAAGLDTSAVVNIVSDKLVAGSKTDYDGVLEALGTKLTASGTTLTTLASSVAASASAGATAGSDEPVLPPVQLLAPHAANCAALRSGTYRVITPTKNAQLADQTGKIKVDAVTLTVTFTDDSTGTWTEVGTAEGACHFTDNGGTADIVVSPSGVFVARYSEDDGSYRLTIGFPEQSHTLSQLAGTWNAIGLTANDEGGYTGVAATATLDAAGAFSAVTWCQNDATWSLDDSSCKSVTTGLSTLKASADGGFDSFDPDSAAASGRVFMYKLSSGAPMVVEVDGDGSFLMFTRQRTETLSPVGQSSKNWNLMLSAELLAPNKLGESGNTIVSVDSTAGSWVRTQKSAIGAELDYQETLFINDPRTGFIHRPAATATAANGTSVKVSEFTMLNMRGMYIFPLVQPAGKSFMFSVRQP